MMNGSPETEGISKEEFRERQARARTAAGQAGYDGLLAVSRSFYDRPGDVAYLTNHFPPFPTTVFSETNRGNGHAFFFLPVAGEPVLITDGRKHRADLVAVDDVRATSDLGKVVVEVIRERGLENGKIGLCGDDILPAAFDRYFAAELPQLKLEPENRILAEMRAIKSPAEVALLRRAALCADAALTTAVKVIAGGGATEREVCAAAIAAAMRAGADFVRYFRVHSGPWSAAGSRWPQAMDRVIELGEIVAVDAIGAFQGYQFDVNRTTVSTEPDAEKKALLETVLEATNRAVEACVAGATISAIAAAATKSVEGNPLAKHLGVMMGHGIGLETVELPYVQLDDQTELRPGMVLCIEPGIFVPGWAGASIEQEVVITASGPPEVITPTPGRLW
jgi:Xaa-Pro aminopeptidase